MLKITWHGNPPSKSNSYRFDRGRWHKTAALEDFEDELTCEFKKAIGHSITWYIPNDALLRRQKRIAKGKGVKAPLPRPENPLYPLGVDVQVLVVHHRKSRFAGPDVDNLNKAIWDAASQAGVWYDDRQIADCRSRRECPREQSSLEITISSLGGLPLPSPLTRPEWLRQKAAEQAIPETPISLVVFCQLCHIGIGRGGVENEVWLLPVKQRGVIHLEPLCGMCADELGLDLDLRVIAAKEMANLSTIDAMALIQQRRKELSVVVTR